MKLKKLLKIRPIKNKAQSELYLQLSRTSANKFNQEITGYILHGASCSGKTYILKESKIAFPDVAYIDIDRAKYWKPNLPEEIRKTFYTWYGEWSKRCDQECRELVQNIDSSNDNKRYTKILITRVGYNKIPFVSTCGNLPLPDNNFYNLLSQCFKMKLIHVLVSPHKKKFIRQINKRGKKRIERIEELLQQHKGRWLDKENYNLIVTDNQGIKNLINQIGATAEGQRRIR